MKVVRVMLGDKEIPLDTPVPVEGMWVRRIGVTVQNVSPKKIVECNVVLDFPETWRATNGSVPSVPMRMGKRPDHGFMGRDGIIRKPNDLPAEIQMLPGSSVTFKAPDGADWDQTEAYKLVNPITKVTIDLGSIYFSDESKWTIGKYYVAVPAPDVWKEVSRDEFNSSATTAQP